MLVIMRAHVSLQAIPSTTTWQSSNPRCPVQLLPSCMCCQAFKLCAQCTPSRNTTLLQSYSTSTHARTHPPTHPPVTVSPCSPHQTASGLPSGQHQARRWTCGCRPLRYPCHLCSDSSSRSASSFQFELTPIETQQNVSRKSTKVWQQQQHQMMRPAGLVHGLVHSTPIQPCHNKQQYTHTCQQVYAASASQDL